MKTIELKTIEFVKEVNGLEITYYTTVDGMYLSETISFNREDAYKKYLEILEKEKTGEPIKGIEILESIKI